MGSNTLTRINRLVDKINFKFRILLQISETSDFNHR